MISPFVATLRLLGFVGLTLALLPGYLALLALGLRATLRYVRFYWRLVAKLCAVHVRVHGALSTGRPTLYVANHASYFDIIVLGGLIEASFVAKSEVAGWPGFGFLARIARTVFVERKRGGSAIEATLLARRLAAGDSLILFPEGTSNDGNRVLPFKTSLFAVAASPPGLGQPPQVQPVSVAYTLLDGTPMTRAFRPFYAWYGDMTMLGHLFSALGLGDVTVDVVLHPPVTIAAFADRKALANHCHDVVTNSVTLALAGRLPPRAEFPAA